MNQTLAVVGVVCAFGTGAYGDTVPVSDPGAHGDRGNDLPPIRVVPQLLFEPRGLVDPTGRMAVAEQSLHVLSGVRIVDLRNNRVAWNLESLWPHQPEAFAFSHDGGQLARCTPYGGEILDLAADVAMEAPWLQGTATTYSPDDRLIMVAAASRGRPGGPHVDVVRVFDRQGALIQVYPLVMNMVGRMRVSGDGSTLLVEGGIGIHLGSRHGGKFTPKRQAIDLRTGASTVEEWTDGPRLGELQVLGMGALPTTAVNFAQRFKELIWDSSTRSAVVTADGPPEGGVIKVWNLRDLGFSLTLGAGSPVGDPVLLAQEMLIGIAWLHANQLPKDLLHLTPPLHVRHLKVLGRFPLPSGPTEYLAIPTDNWISLLPSPDGRHVAGLCSLHRRGKGERIEIWDTATAKMVREVYDPGQEISRYQWTSGGTNLAVLRMFGLGAPSWEFLDLDGRPQRTVSAVSHDSILSPDGNLVVVPERERCDETAGGRETYRVTIKETHSELTIATVDGCELPSRVFFVGQDLVFIAETGTNASVRLVRCDDGYVLWERAVADSVRETYWEPGWEAVWVRLYNARQNGELILISDGRRLPADLRGVAPWYNPRLLPGTKLALDPLFGSRILALRETTSGRTIAVLAAFADPDWLIYTPDGCWMGTKGALDWVAFYRGCQPLTPEETDALHKPDLIRARIAEAFRQHAAE